MQGFSTYITGLISR